MQGDEPALAFLLANGHGFFLLQVGRCGFEFVGPDQVAAEVEGGATEQDDEYDLNQAEKWEP